MQFFENDTHGGLGQMRTQAMVMTESKTQMGQSLAMDIELTRIFKGIRIVVCHGINQIHQIAFPNLDSIDLNGLFRPLR